MEEGMDMLLEQKVKVRWNSFTKKHYVECGYEYTKMNDYFEADIKDVLTGYKGKVRIKCDCCGAEYMKRYEDYIIGKKKYESQLDTCRKCIHIKTEQTNMKRFGVAHPSQCDEVMAKMVKTNVERYGVENPGQYEPFKEKIRNVFIKNYGMNPSQVPEIKKKIRDTKDKNGTIPVSVPQKQLFDIIASIFPDAKLNHPVEYFSLDTAVSIFGVNIDVEYDGYLWHNKRGKYDRQRDSILMDSGWKVLRIKGVRMLPPLEDLLQALGSLACSTKCFQEIILDDWVYQEYYHGFARSL
jgi:hypothetical protein